MAKKLTDLQDLTQPQRSVLEAVEADKSLHETFFLTGGTLLKARGIVPRESNDLDFFTFSTIDSLAYTQQASHFGEILTKLFGANQVVLAERGFRHIQSNMLIDIVADSTSNIAEFETYSNLKTASLKDLAAHKASAICSRDEIKDYIDISFLTKQQNWSLKDLEMLAEQKFKLGTITEAKLLTEILAKREAFTVTPKLFLRDGEKNTKLVEQQMNYLIENTSL